MRQYRVNEENGKTYVQCRNLERGDWYFCSTFDEE